MGECKHWDSEEILTASVFSNKEEAMSSAGERTGKEELRE